MKIQSINPATGQVNKEYESFPKEEIISIAKSSRIAFDEWSVRDVADRAGYLTKLAIALRSKKEEYGKIMTLEMGKPIKQSIAEVEKCAWTAEVFAQNAVKWLEDEPVEMGMKKSYVTHEPLGVILSIMPWNFPFWQAMRFAIPAIVAGNVSILRHSNVVPMSSFAIEEAFRLAGFPENVFRSVLTDHDQIKFLVKSKYTDGVSLTGSVEAGSAVGAVAGKTIKKFVLELGGSDPFIVLDDADVPLACQGATDGRLVNSGQSCICSKRFIVVKSVAEEFTKRFAELMSTQVVGDPMDEKTTVGPLANKQQLDTIASQVKESVAMGAKVECGGNVVNRKGFFYEPTVLSNIKPNMRVAKEEVFGPVAPIFIAKNEREAIKLANSSPFGLGASVWTKDLEKGERVAAQLQAGLTFVNSFVKSDPRIPFGGVKRSGIGRELSRYGLLEFTNTKSVVIA